MKRLGSTVIVLVALSLAACGENKVERGLSPADEESTPESAADMRETEQQRQQTIDQDMQDEQIERFDEAEQPQP